MRHTRIIVTHYGGPEALQVVEEECPDPKDGEVRVRVLAAGVRFTRHNGARGRSSRNTPGAFHAGVGPGRCGGSARQRCRWN